jgi:hypothetical protein
VQQISRTWHGAGAPNQLFQADSRQRGHLRYTRQRNIDVILTERRYGQSRVTQTIWAAAELLLATARFKRFRNDGSGWRSGAAVETALLPFFAFLIFAAYFEGDDPITLGFEKPPAILTNFEVSQAMHAGRA